MARLLDDIEISDILDTEGYDYRHGHGTSGEQLNVQTCPKCGNANWKVYIGADTGLGNCFVCGQTFNKLTFIRAHLGTLDKGTVNKYISDLHRQLGFRPKAKKIEVHVEIPDAVLPSSFALPSPKGWHAPYLEQRGIGAEYAARFKLRLCLFGYHTYMQGEEKRTQHFNDRIIIPIFDLDGEMATFQGRDITGTSDKKYLFPAQMPATGRFLYNGHEALALRAKHVIMCEGAFDVIPVAIACDQFPELKGVVPVGSFGKHLSTSTDERLSQVDAFRKLKQHGALETVTIMWDGEYAALLSALDAAALIVKLGLKARIALLPAGKDPNEVDATVIATAYANAVPYTRLLAVRWTAQNPYAKC